MQGTIARFSTGSSYPKAASLHTLRHSQTSHLLADGVDIATVSERLGYSSVRMTDPNITVTAPSFGRILAAQDPRFIQLSLKMLF